jgi:hypothetical protein
MPWQPHVGKNRDARWEIAGRRSLIILRLGKPICAVAQQDKANHKAAAET